MCLLQLPESCLEACTTSVNLALAGLFKHPLRLVHDRFGDSRDAAISTTYDQKTMKFLISLGPRDQIILSQGKTQWGLDLTANDTHCVIRSFVDVGSPTR